MVENNEFHTIISPQMKKYKITLLFLFLGMILHAQKVDTLNQDPSPSGGINALAVKYYGIDFTKEQRKILKDKQIELIFLIDEFGKPTLSEVNGVSNKEIIDSLTLKTDELENFQPRIRNGIAQPSIYFIKIEFPTYRMTKMQLGYLQGAEYNEAELSDFEYIEKSGVRFDMLFGGMVNQFLGNPAKHLKFGGGVKIDISLTSKKSYIFGLNMSFYGNKLKKKYLINSNRTQNSAPPTLLVGAIVGKWFDNFNIQSEITTAVQNITAKEGDNDTDWTQFKGWSPGIILNYSKIIGKEKTMYYYGAPTLFANNLNFHFGIRYLFLSSKEASGPMMEFGISYRMSLHSVKKYKLKDKLTE